MLDNRELASLILLGSALAGGAAHPRVRVSMAAVLRSFLSLMIVVPLTMMFGYVAAEVWAGWQVGLWNTSLFKATVIWTLIPGAALFFSLDQARKDRDFFWRTAKGTLGAAVLLEFYLNVLVFGLVWELVLQLMLALLAMLAIVAGTREDHQAVKKLIDRVLALIGVGVLALTTTSLWRARHELQASQLLLEFALPIWLTIGFLPFVYLLGVFAGYDEIFRRINHATSDRAGQWRSRFAVVLGLRCRTNELSAFHGHWVNRLAGTSRSSEARCVITDFRENRRAAELAAIDREWTLEHYAGSSETDGQGRRLDRREFKETVEALRWVSTCQMGWYRRLGEYREDLLEIVASYFTKCGLPEEHGVNLRVGTDGQSWYAWRRTVSGWCFAIGAAAGPPDEWQYDGPEPPRGFPAKDPFWGAGPFDDDVNLNWS